MKKEREYLREESQRILRNDPELARKVKNVIRRPEFVAMTAEAQEAFGVRPPGRDLAATEAAVPPDSELVFETIVLRVGRPVLLVQKKDFSIDDPQLNDPDGDIWKIRLFEPTVKANLISVIPAIGRIEVQRNPDYEWLGTGWLVAQDIVATNRHVAAHFAYKGADGIVFRRGFPDPNVRMSARVDFLEELDSAQAEEFVVKDILHIADEEDPDIALLKIEQVNGSGARLADHLRLAAAAAVKDQFVATIGYPAADSRVPDQDLVKKFFGDVYNKKRLAPGQIISQGDGLILHNCSTLGGNSGSPVIDLATGQVLGLHFSGLFLRENRAVTAQVLADVVDKAQRQPIRGGGSDGERIRSRPTDTTTSKTALSVPASLSSVSFQLQIPVELKISLGQPSLGAKGAEPSADINEAVEVVRQKTRAHSEVVQVRKGYAFRNGWITHTPCVVVIRGPSTTREQLDLPADIHGIPIEIRDPGVPELVPEIDLGDTLEGVRPTSYKKPAGFALQPVAEKMKVTCHLSPDAGWPVLKSFLGQTKQRLTIGMYDFTAPNVIQGVLDAVKTSPRKLKLVLQEKESIGTTGIKKDDWPETKLLQKYADVIGDRFEHAAASVGKNRQFASSYHIKVAVRDGKAFWLSSGNWQSTNQFKDSPPDGSTNWFFLTALNREWHVVIENQNLARQFENYLSYDFDNAAADEAPPAALPLFDIELVPDLEAPPGNPTYFKPLTIDRVVKVMPLLTPDNYHTEVLKLITGAQRQILFQNQSLNLQMLSDSDNKNDPRFVSLYQTLVDKQNAGLDVRIIMRGDFNPQTYVERLQAVGFDMDKVRLQNNCHTKGIIIDGKRVLLGSHNWTNEGTLANRDASLIFDDQEIAEYFADAFFFDWNKLARRSIGRSRRVRPAGDGDDEAALQPGWTRVNLLELV